MMSRAFFRYEHGGQNRLVEQSIAHFEWFTSNIAACCA